jgi:capsular polysaccharide biosynthesis protein
MSRSNYIHILVKSWRQLLIVTLAGFVLALAFSFIQPFKYSSTVRLLITQTNATGLDPYTAVKSTERIAQNLSELIYTSAFFSAVTNDPSVDQSVFPSDEIQKRKYWKNSIETVVTAGTGVMSITAYHQDREQATILASRTAKEIESEAPNYFGFSVKAQVIDSPLPSRYFAKPNFVKNSLFGAVCGALLGFAWVLWKVRE